MGTLSPVFMFIFWFKIRIKTSNDSSRVEFELPMLEVGVRVPVIAINHNLIFAFFLVFYQPAYQTFFFDHSQHFLPRLDS